MTKKVQTLALVPAPAISAVLTVTLYKMSAFDIRCLSLFDWIISL